MKDWINDHFKIQYMFTPLGTRNKMIGTTASYAGYKDYFIFGVRIARIQKTNPWD